MLRALILENFKAFGARRLIKPGRATANERTLWQG
jgi:hypothetical protein